MQDDRSHKKIVLLLWVLLAAATLFWLLTAFQFHEARRMYLNSDNQNNVDEANFHLPGKRFPSQTNRNATSSTLRVLTPAEIQSWMTFNYLNYEFSLAPSTLKDALKISDTHYPYLSINKLATENHENATSTTETVQRAVEQVISTEQPLSTSTER
jgi:hypothetical protein